MTSNFSRMPSVTISRSKFKRKSQHKTSLKLGELTPIYLDEVLPGDTRSIDIGSLIRMSTPVTPVMDNIYLDVYAFFVPNRLVWEHWKEFMGENNSSAGIYTGTEYVIPQIDLYNTTRGGVFVGSIGDHFGLPIIPSTALDNSKHLLVSVLPIRGYRRIYNRFFRDQNLIAPLTVGIGDTIGSADEYNPNLLKVAKVSDYFTRALPYAQKGLPVTIPLGTSAPLKGVDGVSVVYDQLRLESTAGTPDNVRLNAKLNGVSQAYIQANSNNVATASSAATFDADLVVDLSKATAATINTLRFAFQYQKLLEKDALYGTRLTAR